MLTKSFRRRRNHDEKGCHTKCSGSVFSCPSEVGVINEDARTNRDTPALPWRFGNIQPKRTRPFFCSRVYVFSGIHGSEVLPIEAFLHKIRYNKLSSGSQHSAAASPRYRAHTYRPGKGLPTLPRRERLRERPFGSRLELNG